MSWESESFWTYKPTVFLMYPLIVLVISLLCYTFLVYYPESDAKEKALQKILDEVSCQQLGKYLIEHSKNYTSGDYYYQDAYHYAEAKYMVCTHGGLSP